MSSDVQIVRRHKRLWWVNALVVALIGVTCTVLVARSVTQSDSQKEKVAAATISSQIASNLTLSLQREQDLAVNTGAFIIADPTVTQQQFQAWTAYAQVFERYPEVVGIAEVVLVTRSQLAGYAAQVDAHPSGLLRPGTTFTLTPAGDRPYYCFPERSQARAGQLVTPADTDICDTTLGSGFLATLVTGHGGYLPYGSGATTAMVVGMPIFRPGMPTDTPQARQAALIGWTGTQLDPGIILRSAVRGHAGTAVSFHYSSAGQSASFASGAVPPGAQPTTVALHNGWSVEVFTPPSTPGLLDVPNVLWLLSTGVLLSLLLGALILLLGTGRSRALVLVDERTDELRHQALHDGLTGLPNRALILDRIGQMLARSRREPLPIAVLFLDLDNFKDINDTMGHRAGDELLIAVGARLTGALREGDSVGRIGGDEFVILAEGASLAHGAGAVADRILAALTAPFAVSGSDLTLSVSASIGYAEGDRATPEALLQDADIALYQAKATGKHCAVRFSPAMQVAVDDRRHLAVDLQTALTGDQFFLDYQPVVDLSSGVMTGVEALLRWKLPGRGILTPEDFIDELESNGPILEVGAWVLDEACRQGARWHAQGHRLTVSVNVSARQFERDRILDDVRRSLKASGFDPGYLILELTETVVMHDVEGTVGRLELLKHQGIRVAIDDFGTGYSSLAYLRRIPIDILKIDQSFVGDMTESAESEALVRTLTRLGKMLGLRMIAEGVETDEQWRRLHAEGVDDGQGYLFSVPLPAGDLERLLLSGGTRFLVPAAASA